MTISTIMRRYSFLLLSATLFTACGDDEPEEIPDIQPVYETISLDRLSFDEDRVWSGAYNDNPLVVDGYSFSHYLSDYGTVEGFTAACQTDTARVEPMYEHQFSVITGGGVAGKGTPYIVGFWSSRETDDNRSLVVARTDSSTFTPDHVMVTNTCYAYYTMLYGSAYSRKFEKGDKFILTAHGVAGDNTEKTADFYLANCTSSKASEGIVDRWTLFDLTSLGSVKSIYFTLTSTDNGDWGMNTPAYFAICDFTVIENAE